MILVSKYYIFNLHLTILYLSLTRCHTSKKNQYPASLEGERGVDEEGDSITGMWGL